MTKLKRAALWGLSLSMPAPAIAQVVFTPLEQPPNSTDARPLCISRDGRVVAGSINVQAITQAYRWVDGAAVPLGFSGWVNSMSADARWSTGRKFVPGTFEAFILEDHGTPLSLGRIPGLPFVSSEGLGISGVGPTVIGFYNAGTAGSPPFKWDASGIRALPTTPPNSGQAFAVSADARAIAGLNQTTARGFAAWWDEQDNLHVLPDPNIPVNQTTAWDINQDGRVIVGSATVQSGTQFPVVRWTNGVPVVLSTFTAGIVEVSDDGWRVIGGSNLWDPVKGWRSLDFIMYEAGLSFPSGWIPLGFFDISGDGTTLLGQSRDGQNHLVGWTLRIPAFCYPNCDGSTIAPALNVMDFNCFLNKFVHADLYADCNLDGATNVLDFNCFLGKFATGCP
jgi:hypothetical protein